MCYVSERIGQGPTTIEAFKDIKGHLRGLVAGTLTSKKAFHFETKAGRSLSVWGFHPIALGGSNEDPASEAAA